MQFKNAVFINDQRTAIDMDFNHPVHGWIQMTITQAEYPETWAQVIAKNPEVNQEIVDQHKANDLAFIRQSLSTSRGKFCLNLKRQGHITKEDAVVASRGEWTFGKDPKEMPLDEAEILWAGMETVRRSDPLIESIRKHLDLTPIQMDELFS